MDGHHILVLQAFVENSNGPEIIGPDSSINVVQRLSKILLSDFNKFILVEAAGTAFVP